MGLMEEKLIAEKKEIRRECRQAREAQSPEDRSTKSKAICDAILRSEAYRTSKTIAVYIETQGEVSLETVIMNAWADGKQVIAPRCHGKTMDFYEIKAFKDLESGYYGVREPRQECLLIEPSPETTMFLTPGVAYDREGGRIGYGGGFYDRYLADHPGLAPIGIAFGFQVYPKVPGEATDIPLTHLITEEGWIR